MKRIVLGALSGLVVLAGCGPVEKPTEAEVAEAKSAVEATVEGAQAARTLLELLGILPVYTCGELRGSFLARSEQQLEEKIGCATVGLEPQSDGDALVVRFNDRCVVDGRTLGGTLRFVVRTGSSRFELEVDPRETSVDGQKLPGKAGYGTCGDEKRVWASASGNLHKRELPFSVDAHVGMREGLPLIGGTTLVMNGRGSVGRTVGSDSAALQGLHYELKELFPKDGTVLVETASGHRVEARFSNTLWRLGKVELTIDDKEPVEVPLVR